MRISCSIQNGAQNKTRTHKHFSKEKTYLKLAIPYMRDLLVSLDMDIVVYRYVVPSLWGLIVGMRRFLWDLGATPAQGACQDHPPSTVLFSHTLHNLDCDNVAHIIIMTRDHKQKYSNTHTHTRPSGPFVSLLYNFHFSIGHNFSIGVLAIRTYFMVGISFLALLLPLLSLLAGGGWFGCGQEFHAIQCHNEHDTNIGCNGRKQRHFAGKCQSHHQQFGHNAQKDVFLNGHHHHGPHLDAVHQFRQIRVHQGDIGHFHGERCSFSHGDSHIGHGQSGGVIDTITAHQYK
mmetsp:Transcript_19548/g.45491  ORF Transcript_19548/g.45491 Transcript_19548/m.45491 type:complete len:289 (+) Transcript_19548:1262-2128(+)